jgi:glucosyl-3-phosphoglycerate synthase
LSIDQAPLLAKERRSTSEDHRRRSLLIGIPAHDEEATIAAAVAQARATLQSLDVEGRVVVAASACTDRTAARARRAGASVIETPKGKGRAVQALAAELREEVMAVFDADVTYLGEEPIAHLTAAPVLQGHADAAVADLFWRPIYPEMWGRGFWAPLVGSLLPEVCASLGRGAWSGQRAAVAALWRGRLPVGFALESALNVRWGMSGRRCVMVPTADWVQPVRPKRLFYADELRWVLREARRHDRLRAPEQRYEEWLAGVIAFMGRYAHGVTDIATFEGELGDHAQRTLP